MCQYFPHARILLVKSRILGFGIRNLALKIRIPNLQEIWNSVLGIWNPLNWNPESGTWNPEFVTWILESTEWNPESMTVLKYLIWGKPYFLYTQRSFCAGLSLSSKRRRSYIKKKTPLYYLLLLAVNDLVTSLILKHLYPMFMDCDKKLTTRSIVCLEKAKKE